MHTTGILDRRRRFHKQLSTGYEREGYLVPLALKSSHAFWPAALRFYRYFILYSFRQVFYNLYVTALTTLYHRIVQNSFGTCAYFLLRTTLIPYVHHDCNMYSESLNL